MGNGQDDPEWRQAIAGMRAGCAPADALCAFGVAADLSGQTEKATEAGRACAEALIRQTMQMAKDNAADWFRWAYPRVVQQGEAFGLPTSGVSSVVARIAGMLRPILLEEGIDESVIERIVTRLAALD